MGATRPASKFKEIKAKAHRQACNYCFYITKFKYHLCYYLNLFAILAKGTVCEPLFSV